MINHFFITLALAFVIMSPFDALPQTAKPKIVYSTINQFGIITGSKGEAMSVQAINGVKRSKAFAGIGVGLDFYGDRTIPLFLDIRNDFSTSKNTPFAYVDGGINFLWLNFIQREQKNFPTPFPSLFYEVGAGWKLSDKNGRGWIVSVGYSLKQVKYKSSSFRIPPTLQLQSSNEDRYNFIYRRLVIKLGFEL